MLLFAWIWQFTKKALHSTPCLISY